MNVIKRFVLFVYWFPTTVRTTVKMAKGGLFYMRDCPIEYLKWIVFISEEVISKGNKLPERLEEFYNEAMSELKLRNRPV